MSSIVPRPVPPYTDDNTIDTPATVPTSGMRGRLRSELTSRHTSRKSPQRRGATHAEALYGTTRSEAIGDDLLPQTDVAKVGGRVEQAESSPQFPPNQRVTSFTDELDGGTRFFKEEIGQMVGKIKENVFTGISVTNRAAMNFVRGNVEEVGGGFNVSATYGPRDGGCTADV